MLVCWSVKGGSGSSVVSALLATSMAKHHAITLVDLQGDQNAILGLATEQRLGVSHWMAAGTGVLPEALSRLTLPVGDNFSLIPAGTAPAPVAPQKNCGERLAAAVPNAVVDAGTILRSGEDAADVVRAASKSLLVIRPCYLAIRRATRLSLPISGVIVIDEPGRSLDHRDIADVLSVPVLATLPWDGALARAVDAGRTPRYHGRVLKAIDRIARDLSNSELTDVA